MRSNKDLMTQARASLKGQWKIAIGGMAVYLLLVMGIQIIPILGWLVSLAISPLMAFGLVVFSLAISRKETVKISQLFQGFRTWRSVWVLSIIYSLQLIFVMLWMLLLIIPGIIAGISYAMTFYIIADDDSVGPLEAIRKSKTMMKGYKWKLACLGCRFLGWGLLVVITLGIGYLWLGPYSMVSISKFYDDIKDNLDVISEAELTD